MFANDNTAPKIYPFTLLFRDKETDEVLTHAFMYHEEHIYSDELDKLLLLPAADMLEEVFIDVSDEESIENFADTLEAIAVVKGHADIEVATDPGVDYNPHLDVFGKPQLTIVH